MKAIGTATSGASLPASKRAARNPLSSATTAETDRTHVLLTQRHRHREDRDRGEQCDVGQVRGERHRRDQTVLRRSRQAWELRYWGRWRHSSALSFHQAR